MEQIVYMANMQDRLFRILHVHMTVSKKSGSFGGGKRTKVETSIQHKLSIEDPQYFAALYRGNEFFYRDIIFSVVSTFGPLPATKWS